MRVIKTELLVKLEKMANEAEKSLLSDPPPNITLRTGVNSTRVYNIRREELRCFLLNKAQIDSRGREIDADGNVIEDENWTIVSGGCHRFWPQCRYLRFDGKSCSAKEYAELSEKERKTPGWLRDGYIRAINQEGESSDLTRNDRELLCELAHDDIVDDPRIAAAYYVAARTGQGPLSFLDMKGVFAKALKTIEANNN